MAESSFPFGMSSDQLFTLVIIAVGCLTGILVTVFCVFSGVFCSIHKHRSELDLKREMLDRGMSAEEIERVVKASPPSDFLERMADRRRC